MSLLTIDRINAGYGEIQVLFDLSLHVNPGEVVSIIGANGAGKSTLLKTISGMLKPLSGTITFAGNELGGVKVDKIVEQGLVHVPEGRRLFALMTVYENLEMGGYNRHASENFESNLQRVYKLFPRLEERKQQLAGTLSGGEQQMVAIGRGMMANPKVMMLDEPSLGLAPVLKKEIFVTIKKIADQFGMTIVLVEQDVINSLAISQRGYVMEQGQVVMAGSSAELLANPHIKTVYLGM